MGDSKAPGNPASLRWMMRLAGTAHRGLYRLTGGRIGGTMRGMPVLLLTTTGRTTGQPRTWPLGYLRDGDDLVIIASAGGHPRHPAWYQNLMVHPLVTVQTGGLRRVMLAETTTGDERSRLWARVVREYPFFADYGAKAGREIPVVRLRPAA